MTRSRWPNAAARATEWLDAQLLAEREPDELRQRQPDELRPSGSR